jgi:hemerythrin-like domain-containing protein
MMKAIDTRRGTRTSSRASARRSHPDAITLLKKDHAEARKLLKQLSTSRESAAARRAGILRKVAAALWTHMQIEEAIFYPAFDAAGKTSDDEVRGIEAHEEHGAAKTALRKLEKCDPSTTEFRALAKVLYDLVDHHADEEEDEMFPRARKLFGAARLDELGEELARAKKARMNGGAHAATTLASRSALAMH